MDRIHSQIIALTKSIYLVEPENVPGYMAQFTVGKPDPFSFLGGAGMTWWYTKTTFKIVENLAFMIIRDFKEFSGCDHEAVQNIIKQTLGEVCVDKRLFNEDDVCFARKKTLFLCKLSNDTKSYASIIADEIFSKLRNSLTNWCVVYAIPRLKGESFFIESEGIHVINKSDNDYWRSLDSKGFITNKWNPESGCYADGSITPFARYKYDYTSLNENPPL